MNKVRVYAHDNDGRVSMRVLTNPDLFDRYEKFLSYERQVRYDYIEVVDGVVRGADEDWIVAELEDFGN